MMLSQAKAEGRSGEAAGEPDSNERLELDAA
jgi:hypothetical protein